MRWTNSATHYGLVTKLLHWGIFALFAYQYVVANAMVRITPPETALGGFSQATLYNWHKSVGLLLLLLALARYTWRRTTRLPDWADSLSPGERTLVHWYERILYLAMFVMPLSGYVYVMSGNYGVHLFSRVHLPNPLPVDATLAAIARGTHIATGWVILAMLALHVGLVLYHQLVRRDGLLRRMLL